KRVNLSFRIALLVIIDTILLSASLFFAYFSTMDQFLFDWKVYAWFFGNLIFCIIFFAVFGLYSVLYSAVSIVEGIKLALSIVSVGFANVIYDIIFKSPIEFTTTLTFLAFAFYLTLITRFHRRIFEFLKKYTFNLSHPKKRVMIVGAGDAGTSLINEIRNSNKLSYRAVCLIDDDVDKLGKNIAGVKIVGTTYDIKKAVKAYRVEEIFITMPSTDKKRISKIVARCKDSKVPVKILPGMYQLVDGQISVSDLREVDIQDLLGRDQVKVDIDEIIGYIENKTVLVTGGGGSIGSELCRQIASHNPDHLIILDIYENNAYDIEQELKRKYPTLHLTTLIASIRDKVKIDNVFDKYRPQIVFHAAAHKHVPLMETSPNEAVKNNVFGTLNVAKAADKYGAETFVQISTDKAVNPTNVMGATKRICEMIIQTIGRHSKNTNFVAVRFGNVLGSNGSVIPLFKKQIAEGGPVTVTHKDIIRYFMTIPEAVSLVLQAGAYAKGGQIFVLDMGEPVKIYDLAYNLIKLSGLEPNVDIEIKCTGLRPGEKLFEERLMDEEGMQTTPNGLINIAQPIKFDEENFWTVLDNLHEATHSESNDMKRLVKDLVPTYKIDRRS
ncbi:MAG: polysaccharide biosynthesis protein, partial [Clostridia bacterium]|nr:polysaccharide biosynthesis protein [Clostridia bacterium]